jgi:hypothetical protein
MFEFDQPYEEIDPNNIRADFNELILTDGCEYSYTGHLLDKLARYIPTDTLRQFMDDLAMGRV